MIVARRCVVARDSLSLRMRRLSLTAVAADRDLDSEAEDRQKENPHCWDSDTVPIDLRCTSDHSGRMPAVQEVRKAEEPSA
jgi:hypothetical protein